MPQRQVVWVRQQIVAHHVADDQQKMYCSSRFHAAHPRSQYFLSNAHMDRARHTIYDILDRSPEVDLPGAGIVHPKNLFHDKDFIQMCKAQ
jgi:hypothetical protein